MQAVLLRQGKGEELRACFSGIRHRRGEAKGLSSELAGALMVRTPRPLHRSVHYDDIIYPPNDSSHKCLSLIPPNTSPNIALSLWLYFPTLLKRLTQKDDTLTGSRHHICLVTTLLVSVFLFLWMSCLHPYLRWPLS